MEALRTAVQRTSSPLAARNAGLESAIAKAKEVHLLQGADMAALVAQAEALLISTEALEEWINDRWSRNLNRTVEISSTDGEYWGRGVVAKKVSWGEPSAILRRLQHDDRYH